MKTLTTRRTVLFFAVSALLTAVVATAAPLYQVRPSEAPVAFRAAAFANVLIAVDTTPIARGAETLLLPLADGTTLIARLESVERRGPGDLVWRGFIDGGGRVTLTLKNGVVAGRWVDSESIAYEIGTTPAGQALAKLDASRFAPCAHDLGAIEPPAQPFNLSAPDTGRGLVDPPNQIDVMIMYTPQARDSQGGVAGVEALAQAAVDAANGAFIDSDMIQRYNLVHTALANRNDSANAAADRNWLATDPDVAALRDEHFADMVGLLVQNAGGFCGIAFLMDVNDDPATFGLASGFQVTATGCAVGNFTYAHEHGHNMGFNHHPAAGLPPAQAFELYAFGHSAAGVARTVMSTELGCCGRVGHFSNPDIDFMPPAAAGNPTGIADARDNARVGDEVAPFAANWRVGIGIFVDGFESGDTSAWSNVVP